MTVNVVETCFSEYQHRHSPELLIPNRTKSYDDRSQYILSKMKVFILFPEQVPSIHCARTQTTLSYEKEVGIPYNNISRYIIK